MCIQQEIGVLPLSSTSESPGFAEVRRTKPKSEGSEAVSHSAFVEGLPVCPGVRRVSSRNVGFC